MDINIPRVNVNIGLYIVSLIAIGFGEKYCLYILFWFGAISGGASLFSILWVLPSYTRNYVTAKVKKRKTVAEQDQKKTN
jgi:hypothetical protein